MDRTVASLTTTGWLLLAAAAPLGARAGTAAYPVGGSCAASCPTHDFPVTTAGGLSAEVQVIFACSWAVVRLRVDGELAFTSEPLSPGQSTGTVDLGSVAPGTHTLRVEADAGGGLACDSAFWDGALSVTTTGVSDDDVAFVAPGDQDTVSTVVAGSPRPAGVTATLLRSQAANTAARISVATYDALPQGVPGGPPIRAAGYLDLQLTDAHPDDVIFGEFVPPNPIFPSNPAVPPNPILPSTPIVPPNPIRLAFWDGGAWSPVSDSQGGVPIYRSADEVFEITFDLGSTPAVTALTGTVFAIVPSFYFRGFGIPVDSGALNVAKAGRAIPLKWQLFDYRVDPVLDLAPALVALSSVAIPCEGASGATDPVEEYATGQSGLQNLGDGVYQLNWATSKSYAGTCRRLLLDLGERNPDGTPFYRTADFWFTR